MSLIIKLIINVSHCSFMGDGCSQINVTFVVAYEIHGLITK